MTLSACRKKEKRRTELRLDRKSLFARKQPKVKSDIKRVIVIKKKKKRERERAYIEMVCQTARTHTQRHIRVYALRQPKKKKKEKNAL